MLPIGSRSRQLLNQSTHSSVAYSTVSNDRAAAMDDLGLEQADHRLGEGVVIGIPDTADRRFDTGLGETLAVFDRDVLNAAVGMMDQAAIERPASMKRLLQCIEDETLPIRLSPTATSGSVRPCSWTFTSVAIFGSHNRSQSSSDFFPTTRPAPPTWRRLAGATGLFAPIVRRRESRSASQIVLASCAAASAAVTPD